MSGRAVALVRLCVLGLLVLSALSWTAARADTPVSLFQAFRGQVNFVGTEETLRTKANNQPCRLVNAGTGIYAYLGGIPSGAKVISAQLYWAGSGSTPDYSVTFDGVPTTAPANRRYTSGTIGGGYNYFAGAADVTSQVAAKGNGYYTFSGLSVNNGEPWCSAQGVVGGFSLLVVYSSPSEAYRLLNVYEGFQYFRNSGFTLTLNNFAIPSPLPASATGRIAHITWEGDATLSGGGEDLLFNGYEMTDSINPSGNQFNSASNVTGDTRSYGIDFDAYTVRYPVIQPGQTTATTTYRSGQDMVLLSAEVAALPYIPVADLALTMTRSGTLQVGSTASYTLSVTNNGADTETGPVTVVDTLPSGLTLSSAKGSGWSCTSAAGSGGQTIVTCTAAGPVASGATMNPLTLTVTPTKGGNYTNSATVTGQTGDTNTANNTASNSGSAADPTPTTTASALVFTARACIAGEQIVAPGSSNGCPSFQGPVVAGDTAQIFITSVSGSAANPVATAPSASTDTRLNVKLTLSCTTDSGVSAGYAGVQLGCGAARAQTVSLDFPPNVPSAVLPGGASAANFSYADVGLLTLTADGGGGVASLDLVARPDTIVIYAVLRKSDGYPDLHVPGQSAPDVAFAKAGEEFDIQLAATVRSAGTAPVYAPSFGNEKNKDGSSAKPTVDMNIVVPSGKDTLMEHIDDFGGAILADKPSSPGLLVGRFQWYEAGILTLHLQVDDYLGTMTYDLGKRDIGRFYPDHFTTTYTWPFQCLPAMACPAQVTDAPNIAYGVGGGAYSGQPVTVTVAAYSLRRAGPYGDQYQKLNLYSPEQDLMLSAVDQSNGAPLTSGGSFPAVKALATAEYDSGQLTDYKLTGTVKYGLATPYDPASPHAGNWSKPLAVYVRAATQDQIMRPGQSGPQPLTISSQITPAPTAPLPPQQEDGIMLVAGRLFVGNVFGSELAQVPLPLTAQYWTGAAWQANTGDSASLVATSLKFGNCTRSFVNACQLTALPPAGGGVGVALASGTGRLTLKAPPRGQNGSIDVTAVNDPAANPDAAVWLPSTTGRASFGLFKGTLIYLREVY